MTETKNQQTQQNANSKKYNDYVNAFCPPDKIIEWFTLYYGESKREYIESVIKNVPVIFIPRKTIDIDILLAYKKVCPNLTIDKLKDCAEMFFMLLADLVTDGTILSRGITDIEIKVLKELGFSPSKLLLKHKEADIFKLAKNEEAERLKNYVIHSINRSEINNDVLDIDSYVSMFNKMAESGRLFPRDIKIYKKGDKFTVSESGFANKDEKFTPDIAKIDDYNLTEEDKQFLSDLINSGSLRSGENDEYIISKINKIFHKNHASIDDIKDDESLYLLFSLNKRLKRRLKDVVLASNINKEDFIPANNPEMENIFIEEIIGFTNASNDAGSYNPKDKTMQITLDKSSLSMSMTLTMHEYNHALSHILNNCGFNEVNSGLLGNRKSPAFNEIVNEYLTQQIIENIPEEDKKR